MQATATSDSLIGFTLGDKYKILRQIGRGGMGVVYEAEHIELGKRVAIKLMLEKYAEDGEAIARFKREALAASRIGNPHIIDVSDIGTAPDGRSFVVMELLIGSSLSDIIEQAGPMPPWRACQIMRQVLRAVGAAHAKNIIHRDLKPDNIFLVNQDDHHDFVKLLDFGISKIVDQAAEIAATKLTTTGMVMGTPLYMAPEQAMGVITNQCADIYALGVILYEMLAGKPPFNGSTYPMLVAQLLTSDPPLLSDVRPGLPPNLVAAVHRALEKEPEQRFQSCDAFANALPSDRPNSDLEMAQTMDSGRVLAASKLKIKVKPTSAAKAKSRLPLVLGAVGGGLAIAAIAIIALSRGGGDAAPKPTASPIIEPIDDKVGAVKVVVTPGSGSSPGSAADLTPKPGVATGHLLVKTSPPGADVIVDGIPIGRSPTEITVAVGTHHVHVELAGHQPMDEDADVAAKEHDATNIMLPKLLPGSIPKPPVKTIKPQNLPHVEPTPPGGAITPTGPKNQYDDDPPPQKAITPPPPLETHKPPPPTTTDKPTDKPGSKPNPYH